MFNATEPAPLPLWPNIWPSWAGNVILTLPTRSNFAAFSWVDRWAAADNACAGVSGLASGEAQAASATIISRPRTRRFTGRLEYIGGETPFPSCPSKTLLRGCDRRHGHRDGRVEIVVADRGMDHRMHGGARRYWEARRELLARRRHHLAQVDRGVGVVLHLVQQVIVLADPDLELDGAALQHREDEVFPLLGGGLVGQLVLVRHDLVVMHRAAIQGRVAQVLDRLGGFQDGGARQRIRLVRELAERLGARRLRPAAARWVFDVDLAAGKDHVGADADPSGLDLERHRGRVREFGIPLTAHVDAEVRKRGARSAELVGE